MIDLFDDSQFAMILAATTELDAAISAEALEAFRQKWLADNGTLVRNVTRAERMRDEIETTFQKRVSGDPEEAMLHKRRLAKAV